MNKYIPADKLIAEIKRLKNGLISLMSKLYYAANYKEWEAELNGYNKVLSLIKSLQQESKDKDVFIQKAIQWMCKTTPIDDVLSVEMIEDFKKTMMEE